MSNKALVTFLLHIKLKRSRDKEIQNILSKMRLENYERLNCVLFTNSRVKCGFYQCRKIKLFF